MTGWANDYHARRHPAKEPTIWVAITLSALLHAAVLSKWLPEIRFPSLQEVEQRGSLPLVVNLVRPEVALETPVPAPAPASRKRRSAPAAALPPPPAPPVLALARPESEHRTDAHSKLPSPSPAADSKPAPITRPKSKPAPRPAFDDLASYIEAKRRARAKSMRAASPERSLNAPLEDEDARANRILAENLGSQQPLTFGFDPERGGGVFEIQLMGYDYAEFTFIGWNPEARRITKQLIEVRQGDNSNIRIAVIRRMIAIIREHVKGDFLWESRYLGYRSLSARLKDTKALEDFLMTEFFGHAGPTG